MPLVHSIGLEKEDGVQPEAGQVQEGGDSTNKTKSWSQSAPPSSAPTEAEEAAQAPPPFFSRGGVLFIELQLATFYIRLLLAAARFGYLQQKEPLFTPRDFHTGEIASKSGGRAELILKFPLMTICPDFKGGLQIFC